jgi:hypothetical protein
MNHFNPQGAVGAGTGSRSVQTISQVPKHAREVVCTKLPTDAAVLCSVDAALHARKRSADNGAG